MNTSINIQDFGSIVAGLLILGMILKNAFPNFPNRFIPLFTWVTGVVSYQVMVNGWHDPQQWLAGVMAAATATGAHSAIKNSLQKEETKP